MEASTRSLSKKRKQPSSSTTISPSNSNPYTGILTRTKIQKYFFHHNRSGSSRKCRSFPNSSSLTCLKHGKFTHLNVVDNRDGDGDDDEDEIYCNSVKDLRARRVLSKPPKSSNGGNIKGDLVGKDGNPKFDCGLIDGKLVGFDCGTSGVEDPNLVEICVVSEEILKDGNPNLLISEMCGELKVNCEQKGLIWGNPNLIISETSDDSRVSFEKEGLTGQPNLVISEACDDTRVNLEIGGKPKLAILEMCNGNRVNSEEKGLTGENPNLSMCDDSKVDCEVECLIGENPNLSMCDDSKVNCEVDCLTGENPNLSVCDTRVDGKGKSLNGAKDDSGQVPDNMSPNSSSKGLQCGIGEQNEENVQTTPPDAVALVRQKVDQSVMQNKCAEKSSPPKQISPIKGGSVEGKKNFSSSKRNLGLNPCSRLKLFKAPNSFSYRRMLPFLMDLAKDEPSAPKSNPDIKNEIGSESKSAVSSSQESINDNSKIDEKPQEPVAPCKPHEINTICKEENFSLYPKTSDSSTEQDNPCTPINPSFGKNQENPVSDERPLQTPLSNDRQTRGTSLDGQIVTLDTVGKEDRSSIVVTDPIATLVIPETSVEPLGVDATSNTRSRLSPSCKRECKEAHLEFEPEESSISLIHGLPKLTRGILKRNPKGCRGICDCLNCASFRLNAERAFEFSRNQWLEAEELATDLMKELSSLRSVLQKSVNGANDNAILPVDQVQDIYKRASNAEDIARRRLNQMNEDLHVHSRIKPLQRPRVTFSSNVQEKIIGVTDLAR